MPIILRKDTVGANIRSLPQITNPVLTNEFLSWDDIQNIMKLIQESNPGLYRLLNELSRDNINGAKSAILNALLVFGSEIERSYNSKTSQGQKLHKLN